MIHYDVGHTVQCTPYSVHASDPKLFLSTNCDHIWPGLISHTLNAVVPGAYLVGAMKLSPPPGSVRSMV